MTCQNCGSALETSTAGALCPACLLREVLHGNPAPDGGTAGFDARLDLPRRFGPYQLIDELGRGGMGVVFRARQLALGRTVAVKMLLAGAYASEAALRRFQVEAEVAASLQHPNIVAIHDYGEVDGQPYYAMDLVVGQNLGERCGGRPLPGRRAAEFLQVLAGAVHYAHERGVLHRDLKPSNVLVDEQDRPRITDFGLAKLLGGPEGATLTGQVLGSPSYAAPEQAAGRDAEINVASDIYGLGALFYHLVTGRAPFNAASPSETLRLVLDTDPAPPRLLNPDLPRDLETICLKCLAKDPARRYSSAAEVAKDAEHFLGARPIRARPPGVLYRMGKFARRNRTAVVAAALVFLSLVLGLGMSLAGFRRAVVQRRAADAARGEAEQLVGLMTQELTPVLQERGGLQQLLKSTEAAVRHYEALPPELRTTKTDRSQANALEALGRLRWRSFNDGKGAETAMRAALILREKIARDNPNDPEAAAAWLSGGLALPSAPGDLAARIPESHWEEILRRGRALHARFPQNLRVTQCLADILVGYGNALYGEFGKPIEALAVSTECEKLIGEMLAAQPRDRAPPGWVGRTLCALADAMSSSDEDRHSAVIYEQALTYCADALKADPGNLTLREQAAEAAVGLSYKTPLGQKKRDFERIAREHYRVLIELNPDDQGYRFGYARAHMLECWHLFSYGPDFTSAQKAFDEFHELLRPFIGPDGSQPSWQWTWIYNRMWLAVLAAWAGEPAEARKEIDRAQAGLAAYCERLPAGSFERQRMRVIFLSLKEYAFYWLRDWSAMAASARECLAEIDAALKQQPLNGPMLVRQAEAKVFLAVAAQHSGRPAEAIALLRPAIGSIVAAPPRHFEVELHSVQGIAEKSLAESYLLLGERELARQAAQALLVNFELWRYPTLTEQDWEAGALTLAANLCRLEEPVRCIGLTDRAQALLTSPGAAGRLTVDGKENLALIAQVRGDADANTTLEALEKNGRELDRASASDAGASERFARQGEATWDSLPACTAISSPAARAAELGIREGYRVLMERHPESEAYRFLFAETHRMDCYVEMGWVGRLEPARAAFRRYDLLLEPFAGRNGYGSVLRTRLSNSLHLAQLAAEAGDRPDAVAWVGEARRRLAALGDRLPGSPPDRAAAHAAFWEELAWVSWWLRDWPELASAAQQALTECDVGAQDRPADEGMLARRAMAEGFAALAFAGSGHGGGAKTAARLQAARDGLKRTRGTQSVYGVSDGDMVVWALEDEWIRALRMGGDVARAKKWADELLGGYEQWAPSFPEYWPVQKHLAALQVLAASVLEPSIPFEAARRAELLNEAAATLAPNIVADRLTIDVQETLREIERLRVVGTNASP